MPKNPRPFPFAGLPGELALLERIRARASSLHSSGVRLGIGDDCALLRLRLGEELAVTTDLSIQDRHFRLDWHPPEAIGHRTLARGLSDLAAMGARPIAAFLSLGLPPEMTRLPRRTSRPKPAWIDRFFEGLLALAAAQKTPLAGGDLAQSPIALADIVLTGAVPAGRALLRSGARPGHLIYVTGSLGGSAAALAELSQHPSRSNPPTLSPSASARLAAHLYPQPRIAQGLYLQRRGLASAAIDISDGLSTDLAHICQKSGVAAEIDESALPVHPFATLTEALHGGEDYELLFTAPPSRPIPRTIAGVPVTCIGRILRARPKQPAILLRTVAGTDPLTAGGWQHFASITPVTSRRTSR